MSNIGRSDKGAKDVGVGHCPAWASEGVATVCFDPTYAKTSNGRLYGMTVLKTEGLFGEETYLNLYASDTKTELMDRICRRGNIVHIITYPGNKRLQDGKAKFINWLWDGKLLERPQEPLIGEVSEMVDVLDYLDPLRLLGVDSPEFHPRQKKEEKK